MAMVNEIADNLATAGFGSVGTDIFTHAKPPTPDSAISLHQFALSEPTNTMNGTVVCERVGLQIQCREADDPTAEEACYAVFNRYCAMANVTIGGTFYQGITGRKSPQKLKTDADGRATFYCEFSVVKTIST